MAIPRVFVSSTCFDLREIRDSLSRFIKTFGFEPILSEIGDVFFHPDFHSHEACVQEISNCQLLILIIGGRFGGKYVHDTSKSITNAEYEAAKEKNIPIFTYIKNDVLTNHHLYNENKTNPILSEVKFPAIEIQDHAIHIFEFIDKVRKASYNNAYSGFDTSYDIEQHLRKQWAGMFFDFLKSIGSQRNMYELKDQISSLTAVTNILKTYSEKILRATSSDNPEELITQLEKQLHTDGLTKLNNRHFFDEQATKYFELAQSDNSEIAVAMIDIDDFKRFNDKYGHQLGDVILVEVAAIIKNSLTELNAIPGRYGGEEFIIFFFNTHPDDAYKSLEILIDRVRKYNWPHNESVSVSIGLYCSSGNREKSIYELVKEADMLLYRAKEQGKDRIMNRNSSISDNDN